jgi:hypothetical protein
MERAVKEEGYSDYVGVDETIILIITLIWWDACGMIFLVQDTKHFPAVFYTVMNNVGPFLTSGELDCWKLYSMEFISLLIRCKYVFWTVGRDSSDGVATGYELDGPGIESRWGEVFRTCPDRPWGPSNLLYNG